MNKITVSVSGPTGSGKTSVCKILAEVLRTRGIQVSSEPQSLVSESDFLEMKEAVRIERALRSIGERTEVIIVEVNTGPPNTVNKDVGNNN